jgi:hypothetical protein
MVHDDLVDRSVFSLFLSVPPVNLPASYARQPAIIVPWRGFSCVRFL